MPRALILPALTFLLVAPVLAAPPAKAQPTSPWTAATFEGLAFRNVGPALTSGRVVDIAVDPAHPDTWYVAAASGGLWKTTNGGTTWKPMFDEQASYSLGCVALDPKDPLTVWVGTGENNSQRSVSYGDGLYKSTDGGKHWENMGLKDSEHIAKILVDPRDSKVVYVAAQGPLWRAGGDRGLYKTTDGGKTWKAVLTISENTGVTDVVMDPGNPDVLYAAAYQRRRHVWTIINGGPEGALYKSTDAGQTWTKLKAGLPKEDLGRVGLAVAPGRPGLVYATIEAANGAGGFFRSTDGGGSWEKRSGNVSGSAQYYQELFVDPSNPDRIYAMDTWMQVSDDGGKTWRRVGEKHKHVDNHALWIDPANADHLIAGCDGGVYESRDRGATWAFSANLPIAQFYRVTTDNAKPFYNLYGGTQDNYSLGGPSRTVNSQGITNADWFVTQGGDGFFSQVDPVDPDTVYAESQYGGLVRFNRKTGERLDIQPTAAPGEEPLRWNWDAPLLISPHDHRRVYFAAQKLFRSDDRGKSWKAVSPDLTRQLDRDRLPVMGHLWSIDAVAKNTSTSAFGNIVALAESPLKEGLIFVGTDDGLLQVTEDGGGAWRKVATFPGVPELTYVSRIEASRHDPDVVYLAFDNHKNGDFKPYVLRSRDRGRSFESITGDLPARGTVYALAEDPVRKGLLFAGTEFGVFFTLDGAHWTPLKGGLPTIAVKDLAIQAREGDLVAATFGRGFAILDDLTPLRLVTPELLAKPGVLFPVRKADLYIPAQPLGARDTGFQGDAFYAAPNPPFGAVFTYFLKDDAKGLKAARHAAEKREKDPARPTWDALRTEALDAPPEVILTVTDAAGQPVRRITGPAKAGMHRVAWDLRYPAPDPVSLKPHEEGAPWNHQPKGPLAAPGTYTVSLALRSQGRTIPLGEAQTFQAVPLGAEQLSPAEAAALQAFHGRVAQLQRAVLGAVRLMDEARIRVEHLQKAALETPAAPPALLDRATALAARLQALQAELSGDRVLAKYQVPTVPAIEERLGRVVQGTWTVTTAPTASQRKDYDLAADAFAAWLPRAKAFLEQDVKGVEDALEAAGAPWTPGRLPVWRKD